MSTTKKQKTKFENSTVLYLHVRPATKTWLKKICKKQPTHVSQSAMAQRILDAAIKNPTFLNAALSNGT